MVRTTKLTKQDDGVYRVEIPEEFILELGWRSGLVLKIDTNKSKLVVEKLSGFMGMWT